MKIELNIQIIIFFTYDVFELKTYKILTLEEVILLLLPVSFWQLNAVIHPNFQVTRIHS